MLITLVRTSPRSYILKKELFFELTLLLALHITFFTITGVRPLRLWAWDFSLFVFSPAPFQIASLFSFYTFSCGRLPLFKWPQVAVSQLSDFLIVSSHWEASLLLLWEINKEQMASNPTEQMRLVFRGPADYFPDGSSRSERLGLPGQLESGLGLVAWLGWRLGLSCLISWNGGTGCLVNWNGGCLGLGCWVSRGGGVGWPVNWGVVQRGWSVICDGV